MATPVIELDRVSKGYQLGASRSSLREAIVSTARKALKGPNQDDKKVFWALRDVSFGVSEGEVLGIVGHNGAGKSTMLKVLSRVTYPTQGRVRTRGRMASLIELGAGFHQDLSGRENIYLNGSIMGLKRREIEEQFDSIVSFAGIERFIDTPVKRYSSGMYVRLAFAVASHVRADLLLVDEVLSVGDLGFQDKSLKKMIELRNNGATIVFISHNMNAVHMFCSRVILMDHGCLIDSGSPAKIIEAFERKQSEVWHQDDPSGRAKRASAVDDLVPLDESQPSGAKPFLTNVSVIGETGSPADEVPLDGSLRVRWHINAPDGVFKPTSGIRVCRASDGLVCFHEWKLDRSHINLHGQSPVETVIPSHQLHPDDYYLEALLADGGNDEILAFSQRVPFHVPGRVVENQGIYKPSVEWNFG